MVLVIYDVKEIESIFRNLPKNGDAFINTNIILSSKDKINNENESAITRGGNNNSLLSAKLIEQIIFLIYESHNEGKVCRN